MSNCDCNQGRLPCICKQNDTKSELAALREELVVANDACAILNDQLKTVCAGKVAAEQRNVRLALAIENHLKGTGNSPGANRRYAELRAALKPTESGASE